MKHNFLKSTLLVVMAVCSTAAMAFTNFEIDLRDGQLGTSGNDLTMWLVIDGSTYNYVDAEPAEYNAYFLAYRYNGNQHGYEELSAMIPVEAGNYKVTLGACGYGNGAGSVTDENQIETFASFNQQIEANNRCYHQNTTDNVVTATFTISTAQSIIVTCGQYTPYFKIEKLEAPLYTVSFAKPDGVEGTVPASIEVAAGDNVTIPVNRTLYKEGYTLICWTNGSNNFATGTLFSPSGNVELEPVFSANASDFLTATSEFSVTWAFEEGVDATPSVEWNGNAGFLVKQATVGTMTVDIKLEVDATSGKFYNVGRGANWAQVNDNTVFRFPAKAGAVAELIAYNEPTGSDLDGAAHSAWASNTATFTTTKAAGQSELTVKSAQYCRSLKVTYPASEPTALENTAVAGKAQKVVRDGQVLIIREGKTYNALGVEVK